MYYAKTLPTGQKYYNAHFMVEEQREIENDPNQELTHSRQVSISHPPSSIRDDDLEEYLRAHNLSLPEPEPKEIIPDTENDELKPLKMAEATSSPEPESESKLNDDDKHDS